MKDEIGDIDLLTGAFGRRHFEQLVAEAVARARKAKKPVAVLHLDVDDCQERGELYGRDSVDAALSAIASEMSTVLDGRAVIGRVGADELAALLEGVSREEARRKAERIRRTVSSRTHRSPAGPFRLTVSVGVAVLRPMEASGNLLDAAEDACRNAKRAGRDAVVMR